jgi:hypothetical protein
MVHPRRIYDMLYVKSSKRAANRILHRADAACSGRLAATRRAQPHRDRPARPAACARPCRRQRRRESQRDGARGNPRRGLHARRLRPTHSFAAATLCDGRHDRHHRKALRRGRQ